MDRENYLKWLEALETKPTKTISRKPSRPQDWEPDGVYGIHIYPQALLKWLDNDDKME
jgi:hypothetical protein